MSKGHGVSGNTHSKEELDYYANQHNPNNREYDHSRNGGERD